MGYMRHVDDIVLIAAFAEDIQEMERGYTKYKHKINADKTKYMKIGRRLEVWKIGKSEVQTQI